MLTNDGLMRTNDALVRMNDLRDTGQVSWLMRMNDALVRMNDAFVRMKGGIAPRSSWKRTARR